MVTAELAVAIPALTLVLLMALTAVRAGIDQVRCTDAARVGARLAARGEAPEAVRREAARVAPEGAQVSIGSDGNHAIVEVHARGGGLAGLPEWDLHARSVARLEQVVADAPA